MVKRVVNPYLEASRKRRKFGIRGSPRTFAAKRIQSAWRMKMQRRRLPYRSLGRTFGAKRNESNFVVGVASRTLYSFALDDFQFGTSTQDRERNRVLYKGIQAKLNIRNQASQMRVFRWAIIMPKVDMDVANLGINFFQGYTGERGIDFSQANRSGFQMCNYPINRSVHNVLHQGKIFMGGSGTSGENKDQLKQVYTIFKYLRLNKKMTFDSAIMNTPYKRIFWVHWWDVPLNAAGAASDNNFSLDFGVIKHFADAV